MNCMHENVSLLVCHRHPLHKSKFHHEGSTRTLATYVSNFLAAIKEHISCAASFFNESMSTPSDEVESMQRSQAARKTQLLLQ